METFAFDKQNTESRILCCDCGLPIIPNPANMCEACLKSKIDITSGIPKQVTVYFCRGCERYLNPPAEWVRCPLESRELLYFCEKKLKAPSQLKFVDAGFVWTEPHSKRIKVKFTAKSEIITGGGTGTLEQMFIVEYIVAHQMCPDCHRSEAQDFWNTLVQVRQRCDNKKTFYYLEQLILKHRAHHNTLGIKPHHEGIDFFFATEGHASKMVDFITSVLPIRSQESKKMISHDIHSNTYNTKTTWSLEIVPLSKDSVVCLSKKLRNQLGGISPLCIVLRVSNLIHLIDPKTAQVASMNGQLFFRQPFKAICNPKDLVEFIVLNIELIPTPLLTKDKGHRGVISKKHYLVDVHVVKASELGIDENGYHIRTHLGGILKYGDSVLGYCLKDSNVNDDNYENLPDDAVPDVILVKKYYGDRSERRKHRNWKLKNLNEEGVLEKATEDFQDFLEDLEEDQLYRQNVNIYKNQNVAPIESDDDNSDYPHITLTEMLEDLKIDEEAMMD